MVALGQQFDATVIEPSTGSAETLPAGKYRVAIVKSEWKNTSKGNGRFLEISFEVLSGDHKGSRVVSRLNLENPNATAVRIAQEELSAICHAVGVMKPTDTAQLHNIPLVVGVKVRKYQDKDGNDRSGNEVGSYESVEAASQTQVAPAAVDDKAPWEQ